MKNARPRRRTSDPVAHIDRRQQPRIEILGRLAGEILPQASPVEVRDVSLGGFSVVTQSALEPGTIHDFRLTLNNWSSVELRARVVHCRQGSDTAGPHFVSGLEFVTPLPSDPSPATDLIDQLTSSLEFD